MQRVKAKKGPKIEQLDSKQISEEEIRELEEKGLAEEKKREETNPPKSQQTKQGVCYKFNLPAGCMYPSAKCRYRHVCKKCDGSHPQQKCTK